MKKQKRFQFKYLPFSHFECKDVEDYDEGNWGNIQIVNNPTPYDNLPDGEYLIRGNEQFHCKLYHYFRGVWYLMDTSTKASGRYSSIVYQYELFPCLKPVEWEELGRHYSKLTKYWKRMTYGYFRWKELRELNREITKTFLN